MNFNYLKQSLMAVYFLAFSIVYVQAQETTLVGFLDNKLVSIDEESAEIQQEVIFNSNIAAPIRGFTFSEHECVFYGIENRAINRPQKLVRFDLEGNYEVIDTFSIENGVVWFCESLAYNSNDQKLYASASLNGDFATQGDAFSEAIIEVNPMDASCTKIVEINYNNGNMADVDGMAFGDGNFYLYDGVSESQNISKFYKFNASDLSEDTVVPELILTDQFYKARDSNFAYKDGKVYFTTLDLELYDLDIITNTVSLIGETHTINDFEGGVISGLAVIPSSKIKDDIAKGAPKAFTYQGLATDTRSGRVIRNREISIEASLIKNEPQGEIVYTETHDLMTDNFGFFSTAIGAGFPTLGDFANIDWSSGCYFLQISIDVRGGSDYSLLGVTQLLSVPYALYAEQAGAIKNNDLIMKSPNGKCWEMSMNNVGEAVFKEVSCQ